MPRLLFPLALCALVALALPGALMAQDDAPAAVEEAEEAGPPPSPEAPQIPDTENEASEAAETEQAAPGAGDATEAETSEADGPRPSEELSAEDVDAGGASSDASPEETPDVVEATDGSTGNGNDADTEANAAEASGTDATGAAPVDGSDPSGVAETSAERPGTADPPQTASGAAPGTPEPVQDLSTFSFGGVPKDDTPVIIPADERAAWSDTLRANTPDAYRRFLDAFPDSTFADTARSRMSRLAAQADRRAELGADCDRLAGDPADPGLSGDAAGVPIDQIDADEALWTCSRARAADPGNARIAYNLARVAEALGDPEQALEGYHGVLARSYAETGGPHVEAGKAILRLSAAPVDAQGKMAMMLLRQAVEEGEAAAALTEELDALRGENVAAVAAAEALTEQVTALTARELALTAEIDDLKAARDGDAARIADLQAEVAGVAKDNRDLEVRLTETLQALDDAEAGADELLVRIRDLEEGLTEAEAPDAAGVEDLTAEVEELRKALATAEARAAEAEAALDDLRAQLAEADGTDTGAVDTLTTEIERLTAELADATARAEAAEAADADQVEALLSQISDLQAQLAEAGTGGAAPDEIEALTKEIADLKTQLFLAEEDKAAVDEQVSELTAKVAELETELAAGGGGNVEELTQRIEELERSNRGLSERLNTSVRTTSALVRQLTQEGIEPAFPD